MKWYIRNIWIFYLPFLFTPNFWEFNGLTPMGTLELMDIFIFPYLLLLFITPNKKGKRFYQSTYKTLLFFIIWAFIGLCVVPLKYDYANFKPLIFSALKLIKFILYSTAGYMTVRKLGTDNIRAFYIALLIIGFVIGYSVFAVNASGGMIDRLNVFSAANVLSVGVSILAAALVPFFILKNNLKIPVLFFSLSLVFMLIGLALSDGRGGMVAFFLSFVSLIYFKITNLKIWAGVVGGIVVLFIGYFTLEEFRYDIDRTFFPNELQQTHMQKYGMGVGGVDDGKRLDGVIYELPKFIYNPIFGTGFFHRTYKTGIMAQGSHNFFLQMLLETGIIGFYLMIMFFRRMWKQAKRIKYYNNVLSVSIKMAIIAAVVGGMTGEYFYAGEAFMLLQLTYAPLGMMKV